MKKILYLLLSTPIFLLGQEQDPCYSINEVFNQMEVDNPSITKNFISGWNMFGYPCSQSIDLSYAFSSIVEKVIIVKDNGGNVYMPEFSFNGIGFLEGGEGYQIKMTNTEYGFSFCEHITWPNLLGCTDCEAVNFNQWANIDDGSCNYDSDGDGIPDSEEVVGCQDEGACNYNVLATDSGECTFAEQGFECFEITQGNIHQRVSNWISNPDSTEAIYGHISSWDVSNVTDMSNLFKNYLYFNEDLSSWNVSNVTNMWGMFFNSNNFTSDLSSWDVSNVTNMGYMFASVYNFASDLSSWNVSNVIYMNDMFYNANNFTSDLSSWDVSNVTDMGFMFADADNFTSDLSSWDVSNVTDMRVMFIGCDNFTSDLSSWDVSNVTNMNGMFQNAQNFSSNLSSWNVSNVTDMSNLFRNATNFNSNLSSWDVSNVAVMGEMFNDATSLSFENQCAIQESFSTNPYWPYQWECPIVEVGDVVHGGIVFYVDETGEHGLVAAMEDLGEMNWNDAFNACESATIQGYDDWYLPSIAELGLMYNTIGNGSLQGNVANFVDDYYWSSTEKMGIYDSQPYNFIDFENGWGSHLNNVEIIYVRPIRSF